MADQRSSKHCGPSTRSVITDASGDVVIRRWEMAPLVQEIFTLNNLMIRMGDRLVSSHGLTGTRWMMIGALKDYHEAPTLTELSNDALLSVQNVSRMVSSMEEEGLVERFTQPGKGRSVFVRLTEKAKQIDEQTECAGQAFVSRFLDGFSEDERSALQDMVDRLIVNLARFEREIDERTRKARSEGAQDASAQAVASLTGVRETEHGESE